MRGRRTGRAIYTRGLTIPGLSLEQAIDEDMGCQVVILPLKSYRQ
ncbi:MAG: hypothetical protein R6V59_04575 [Dehalococcoidia bacterium]